MPIVSNGCPKEPAQGAILKARRQGKLISFTDLRKLGFRAPEQASPSILLSGQRPLAQLSLF